MHKKTKKSYIQMLMHVKDLFQERFGRELEIFGVAMDMESGALGSF